MVVEVVLLGPAAGLSIVILVVSIVLLAMCVCWTYEETDPETDDTVDTRAISFKESPNLPHKPTTMVLSGETLSSVQVDASPILPSTPIHMNSPMILHVSDRALPTPPGRPQSMPAGMPSTMNGPIRGRHRQALSQAPPSPVPPAGTPEPHGPSPSPPALGEYFARNEGIPDIDAESVGGPSASQQESVANSNQGDIPYTVISVREPLASLREETQRLLLERQQHPSSQTNSSSGAIQSPSGRSGEQYYAVVQQDEEMYAEIESANSSVTYARIEPRQGAAARMSSPPSNDTESLASPPSNQATTDHNGHGVPAPPTVESLRSVAQAHSRQASTSSIMTTASTATQNGQMNHGGDVTVLNNLYSAVDRSQKHQRKISNGGHHSDNASPPDFDQLYAKVAKKSKRPSPPPSHGHIPNMPIPPPPPISNQHANHTISGGFAANDNGTKFENNNHIGSILPPMTLKRKGSRASRDEDEDPCYEMVGGGKNIDDEPKYERLKGSASSDIDPNYELLKNDDPCYEALGARSNFSDADPKYERVCRRESDVTDPNYERITQNDIREPRYERVRPIRDDSSDLETDPCYERVGPKELNEPQYERVRAKAHREDSLSSDPGYETVKKPNGIIHNGQVRVNGRSSQRSVVTVNSHVIQEPEYETVNTPEVVML